MALPEGEEACEQTVELLRQISESEVLLSVADGILFKASDVLTRSSIAAQSLSHAEEKLMQHTRLLREQALLLLPIFRLGCRDGREGKAVDTSNALPRFLDFALFVRKVRTMRDRGRQVSVTFGSLKHVGLLNEESVGRRVITERALTAVQALLNGLVEVAATLAETPSPFTTPNASALVRDGEQRQPLETGTPLRYSLSRRSASQPEGAMMREHKEKTQQPEMTSPMTSLEFHSTSVSELEGGKIVESTVVEGKLPESKQGKVKLNEVRLNGMKSSESRFSAKSELPTAPLAADEVTYKSDNGNPSSPSPQLPPVSHASDTCKSPWTPILESQSHAVSLFKPCDVADSPVSPAAARNNSLTEPRAANSLLSGNAHAPPPPDTSLCVSRERVQCSTADMPVETRVTAQRRVFSGDKWPVVLRDNKIREEGGNNWREVFISEVAQLFGIPCHWVMNVMAEFDAKTDGDAAVVFDLRLPVSIAADEITHRIRHHEFLGMLLLYEQIPNATSSPSPPPMYFHHTRASRHSVRDSAEGEGSASLALFLDQVENAEQLARDFISRDEQYKRNLIFVTMAQSQRMRERQRLRALAFTAEESIPSPHFLDEGSKEEEQGEEAGEVTKEDDEKGGRQGKQEKYIEAEGMEMKSNWEGTEGPSVHVKKFPEKTNSSGAPHSSSASPPPPPPFSRCFSYSLAPSPPHPPGSEAYTGSSPPPTMQGENREGAKNYYSVSPLPLAHHSTPAEKSSHEEKWLTTTHEKVLRGDAWDNVLATEMDELYRIFPMELAELFELPVENVRNVRFTLGSLHVSFELIHDQYLKESEINELLAVFEFPRVRALYKQCVGSDCVGTPQRRLDATSNSMTPRDESYVVTGPLFSDCAEEQQNGYSPFRVVTGVCNVQSPERMYGLSARGVRNEADEPQRAASLFWSGAATPDNEPVTFSHLALVHDVPVHLLLEANPQLSVFGPSDALPETANVIIPRAAPDDMRCMASSAPEGCDVRSSRSITPLTASPRPTQLGPSRDREAAFTRVAAATNLSSVARRMNVSLQSLRQRNAHLDKYGDTEALPRNCPIHVSAVLFTAEPLSGRSSVRSSPRSPILLRQDLSARPTAASVTHKRNEQQQQQNKPHQPQCAYVEPQSPSPQACETLSGPPSLLCSAARSVTKVPSTCRSLEDCSPAKAVPVHARESTNTDAAVRRERAVLVMAHSASIFLQMRYFTVWQFAVRLRPRKRTEAESGKATNTQKVSRNASNTQAESGNASNIQKVSRNASNTQAESGNASKTPVATSLQPARLSRPGGPGGVRANKSPLRMPRNHAIAMTREKDHAVTTENGHTLNRESGHTPRRERGHTLSRENGHTLNRESGHTPRRERGHTLSRENGHTLNRESGHTLSRESGHTLSRERGHTPRRESARTLSRGPRSASARSVSGGRGASASRALLSLARGGRGTASPRGDPHTVAGTDHSARARRATGPPSRTNSVSSQSRDGRSPRIGFALGLDERIAEIRFLLDMRVSPSMIVVEVRGAAALAGVQRGDEVREANGVRVRTLAEFRAVVDEMQRPHVRITVRRAAATVSFYIRRSNTEGDSERDWEKDSEKESYALRNPVIAPPAGASQRGAQNIAPTQQSPGVRRFVHRTS